MCKIDFYLLPSDCYNNITIDDIFIFEKIINKIKLKDKFFVPKDFYEQTDKNTVSASDYLLNGSQTDESSYLREIIFKEASTDDGYDLISNKNHIGYAAFASDKIESGKEDICAYRSEKDVIKVKRFYIMQAISYEEYCMWVNECFPDLLFCENAFNEIQKLGKFQEIKEELHRHLVVLCDNAKDIYYKCGKKEEDAYAILKSQYGIFCSGKGSNEKKEFKVDYNGLKLTCNPHTKLFTKYSNQRIYFCWGRDEIENHNIIIARIGNHWK